MANLQKGTGKTQAQAQGLNLGGIFGGSSSTKRKVHGAYNWNQLSGQAQKDFWARVNDVFTKILGRQATMGEAQKAYQAGYGTYALEQKLYMSNEFQHSPLFKQMSHQYNYYLQQFVGPGVHLNAKQVQSFAAHGYTSTDIQAWVYHQPQLYMRSNDYQTRVDQMLQEYRSVFGLDPAQQLTGAGTTATNKGGLLKPAQDYSDPLLQHIQAAALHFSTPDEYKQYLLSSPQYKNILFNRVNPSSSNPGDSGLSINAQGRPVQNGISPIGAGNATAAAADVGM
jgi:hypothetical protein